MNPRQTRIKVMTTTDGKSKYTPQHKRWIRWYDFNNLAGISGLEHTNAYHVWYQDDGSSGCGYGTLEHAQELIDTYIEKYNKEEARRNNIETASVTYIKYP